MIRALVILLALTSPAVAVPPLGLTTRAVVHRVVDGDTIDVQVTYTIRVRMESCWAPEKKTPEGRKAWEDLDDLALGKHAIVHIPTAGARSLADLLTLDRVVGTVWLAGMEESLSAYQIRMKNASSTKIGKVGE